MEQAKLSTLDNGITVVTQEVDSVESASLGFWVKAGSCKETEDTQGISHFLEHMAFKGTIRRTARQIAEEIESVGGSMNAFTSRDITAYYAKVLKDDFETALDILSDILVNPTFANDELERERGVILQEINQTIDTPDDIIFDHFQNTAFPNQSIGRPILGTPEVVSRISADDLRSHRAKHYTADSIVFSAAGNVKHERIVELLQKYVGQVKTPRSVDQNITPSYRGGYYADYRPKLEQTHLIYGFNGLSYLSEDYYTAALFSSILGEGMSSRLFQEVREKRGWVYSIYSFTSSYKDAGLFGVYTSTSPEKVEQLLDIVRSEIASMHSISSKEFDRTKAQYKAALLMNRESTSATCDQIASQTILFGAPLSNDNILKKIDAVTPDMIVAYTDKLTTHNASLIVVGGSDCRAWYDRC